MFSDTLHHAYLNALGTLDYLLTNGVIGPWLLMLVLFIAWLAILAY